MKIAVFLNELDLGGTAKAASLWAQGLAARGHDLRVIALEDGPRRRELERHVEVRITPPEISQLRDQLRGFKPDVIHAHAPGHPHRGDILGAALAELEKIPVLQTNVFGQLENPSEDSWIDFRVFVSWTSCVQAARRYFHPLDGKFFRSAGVAVNPLEAAQLPHQDEIDAFRTQHGVTSDEILFGRISRPEPNKWTDLALKGFRAAACQQQKIKLLLREPPAAVTQALRLAPDRDRFVLLPATTDEAELQRTMASLDAVLHTSVIGESFGYGIAEPMNLRKPVIANSTPWGDQAQLELVGHRECGIIASNTATVSAALLALANNRDLRLRLGAEAQEWIRQLADPKESTDRLENYLLATAEGRVNPRQQEDLEKAEAAASYLDQEQFGHTWREQLALRTTYYRVRFHQMRNVMRKKHPRATRQ